MKSVKTALLLFIFLIFTSCSPSTPLDTPVPGSQNAEPTLSATASPEAVGAPADPETDAALAIGSLEEARKAVVWIQAEGTFLSPEGSSLQHPSGRGSGFLISSTGLAVTDHHVVTGAQRLTVRVGESSTQDYPATLVGLSECDDLALIQLEGENFPYFQWRSTPVNTAAGLYIAGFSLESGQFSLLRGELSASGKELSSRWSVGASVLEYDAFIEPGLSGGPILDSDGRLVGIHQVSLTNARRGYGLDQQAAQTLIGQLQAGEYPNTWGVNGYQTAPGESTQPGLWVSALEPGFPAQKAGLQAGDVFLKAGDQDLSQDETLLSYCQALKNTPMGQPLAIQVLRPSSGQVLEGELNGAGLTVPEGSGTVETAPATVLYNPNASSSGDIYFGTEFDSLENWATFALPETQNFEAGIREDTLYVQVNRSNTSVYGFYQAGLPADVRIDAQVRTVSGPNRNNISLICRASETGWYEFSMNSGGYWFIWRYNQGTYWKLMTGASRLIKLQKAENRLTAACVGQELSISVNDTVLGTVRDSKIQEGGQVGISVSTFDLNGAGVEFENFRVVVP